MNDSPHQVTVNFSDGVSRSFSVAAETCGADDEERRARIWRADVREPNQRDQKRTHHDEEPSSHRGASYTALDTGSGSRAASWACAILERFA